MLYPRPAALSAATTRGSPLEGGVSSSANAWGAAVSNSATPITNPPTEEYLGLSDLTIARPAISLPFAHAADVAPVAHRPCGSSLRRPRGEMSRRHGFPGAGCRARIAPRGTGSRSDYQ